MKKRCFAKGCKNPRGDGHLMCLQHWGMVPPETRSEVIEGARGIKRGQSHTSTQWVRAARKARSEVAAKEGV